MLVRIKFGGWAPNCHYKTSGGFKFGGLVWDSHIYEILADFNLVVVKVVHETAKFNSLPSFPAM